MKVRGMVDPGSFTVEQIPGTNTTLVRLFQNITPCHEENFDGFSYDEYHVEVETWDGVAQSVQDNYDEFLKKGMDNEIDRSYEATLRDIDAMNIDHEYRLTLLELGLSSE